jgi:hypothetical protein
MKTRLFRLLSVFLLVAFLSSSLAFAQDATPKPPLPPGVGSFEELTAQFDYDDSHH